jgi:hypothetical protein
MLELNISQNNNSSSSAYGKWFSRVEYKKTMSIDDMAQHMAAPPLTPCVMCVFELILCSL